MTVYDAVGALLLDAVVDVDDVVPVAFEADAADVEVEPAVTDGAGACAVF
ncbi:hypothetical protein WN982_36380 [Paraburkholderia sp. IMGN_8]